MAQAHQRDGRGQHPETGGAVIRAVSALSGVGRRAKTWSVALAFFMVGSVAARAAAPVVFQTGPGRFEIAAADADDARVVTSAAENAWRILATPFGVPDGFSTPVLVRVVPATDWRDAAPFRVIVEPGALVSVRLPRHALSNEAVVRTAVVHGLLLRLAVMQHGAAARLTIPRWLEQGAVGWWRTQDQPAQLDALKQASARRGAARMGDILSWARDNNATSPRGDDALWLMAFLRGEAARPAEWHGFVQRLLGGEASDTALAASFPGRFRTREERELWWQTGYHALRSARLLPVQEAAESRAELTALLRFVFADGGGDDSVLRLAEVLAHGAEPAVAVELQRRGAQLERLVPALHPFFRNAGLSLAQALASGRLAPAKQKELCARFDEDWRDALELSAAATAALDALEAGPR